MFGKGSCWGIPLSYCTLGSIAEKPGVMEGRIAIREYPCVTLSFDHNVIDWPRLRASSRGWAS